MRTPSKHLKTVLVIIALVVNSFAQQTAQTASPNVERLRTHIEYLASDKLEGRKTGTAGANLAAEYIAREFSRIGLRRSIGYDTAGMSILEADSPNRYLQKFPYVAGVELGNGNRLVMRAGQELQFPISELGRDWMPLGFSPRSKIDSAPVVFAGYGISAPDLKYDDFANSNVKGNVAVVFSGTPDGNTPHGQFARAGEVRFKAAAAQAAGARALIIITSEPELKNDRLALLTYDNAGEAAIPVIVVSRQMAQRILRSPQLADYESIADSRMVTRESKSPVTQATHLRQPHPENTISIGTDIVRSEVKAANVIGILDGSDPKLKSEAIVIGAHYDHLGLGGEGSLAPKEGEIHHGADDNASGVAGVLELARFFAATGNRPRRTIVFMAFGGEEGGLLGSNYYVNHPIFPLASTVAMINMDMIGRMKNNRLIVGGVGTAENWREFINSANASGQMNVTAIGDGPAATTHRISTTESARRPEMPIVVSANGRTIVSVNSIKPFELSLSEDGFGPSDHSSFYAKKIPVLFFWTGTHEDYHKPSDTAEKINYEDEARILNFVARVVRDIDENAKRPTYAVAKGQPVGRTGGFSVSLGTIPSYADSTDGLLIDGVRDGSPAAAAGIVAGDKIVKLAGRDVRNVYDYTAALGEMKAGQEYDVELTRNGERFKLKIIPAARK